MSHESNLHELEVLHTRVKVLEAEVATTSHSPSDWPPRRFYTVYYALAGFVLGGLGALVSLLLNVVISFYVGQHPLHIIHVYLTIAMGESALTMNNSLTLAMGCCLYLMVGMVLGIPFHLILSRWFETSTTPVRFAAATFLALSIWIINFYCILSWLQPMLYGEKWILIEIPWWLAAATHLVYGWTMMAMQPLGKFVVPVVQRVKL